jgi:hypothetical protein
VRVKGLLLVGLCVAGCGGAGSAPREPQPAARPARDEVAGCWRDRDDGSVLCLEERGYVLFLADGKWDRVVVDWAEKSPTERAGRTRTPRPLWLAVQSAGGKLVLDDGERKTELVRPGADEQARLQARIARLPEVALACDAHGLRAGGSRRAGTPPKEPAELASPRVCIGYLNAISEVLRVRCRRRRLRAVAPVIRTRRCSAIDLLSPLNLPYCS